MDWLPILSLVLIGLMRVGFGTVTAELLTNNSNTGSPTLFSTAISAGFESPATSAYVTSASPTTGIAGLSNENTTTAATTVSTSGASSTTANTPMTTTSTTGVPTTSENSTTGATPTTTILTTGAPPTTNGTTTGAIPTTSTTSSTPTTSATPTSAHLTSGASPTPTSIPPCSGFDAASFFGGILLAFGVVVIAYLIFRWYKSRNSDQPYRQF